MIKASLELRRLNQERIQYEHKVNFTDPTVRAIEQSVAKVAAQVRPGPSPRRPAARCGRSSRAARSRRPAQPVVLPGARRPAARGGRSLLRLGASA